MYEPFGDLDEGIALMDNGPASRLVTELVAYRLAERAGLAPTREELAARHPECADDLDRYFRDGAFPETCGCCGGEADAARAELGRQMEAINELSQDECRVLTFRYVHQNTPEEIAAKLNVNLPTAERRVARARLRLDHLLTKSRSIGQAD